MRPALVLAGVLALAACSGDGGDDGQGQQVGTKLQAPGAAAVELVAPPTEGAGETPTFEWKTVQGATAYALVVQDADGNAVWAWQGEGTSVALGGVPDRPAGAEGPVLTPGSSWSVAALDAGGHVVGVSVLRPVSP